MTSKPSEKSTEILFNHYLLQMFQPGEISLIAPSTVEEYLNGYDSKIIGINSFKEIYLQFKSPSYYSHRTDKTTIKTSQGHLRQHHLLKSYPPYTAYYVFHTFKTVTDLLDAQRTYSKPEDFLKNYIAVEVSQLPKKMTFMHYAKDLHRGCGTISPGYMRIPYDFSNAQCIRGDELALSFRNCMIGTWFALVRDSQASIDDYNNDRVWHVSTERMREICNEYECIDGDFGVSIRIEFNHLDHKITDTLKREILS